MKHNERVHTTSPKINITIEDRLDHDSLQVLRAVQGASAERVIGTYRGQPVAEGLAIIVWEEGHLDEAVCVVEFFSRRITWLDGAMFCHPELDAQLAALDGWDAMTAEGPIAAAARHALREVSR